LSPDDDLLPDGVAAAEPHMNPGQHIVLVSVDQRNPMSMHEGKERISHTEQLRIEQSVAEMSRAAARDRSANLSDAAIGRVEADDAGVRFSKEQLAAIHALGAGGKLSLMTGVAGSGKTTLLKPLVDAWRDDDRTVVGMSTAWRQADALQEAGADETIALQPLLNAVDTGEFSADENNRPYRRRDQPDRSPPDAEAPRTAGQNRHDHQDARRPQTGAVDRGGRHDRATETRSAEGRHARGADRSPPKNDRDRKIAALSATAKRKQPSR
jgi:hypothetical protein